MVTDTAGFKREKMNYDLRGRDMDSAANERPVASWITLIAIAMALMFSPDSLAMLGNGVRIAGLSFLGVLLIAGSIHCLAPSAMGKYSLSFLAQKQRPGIPRWLWVKFRVSFLPPGTFAPDGSPWQKGHIRSSRYLCGCCFVGTFFFIRLGVDSKGE